MYMDRERLQILQDCRMDCDPFTCALHVDACERYMITSSDYKPLTSACTLCLVHMYMHTEPVLMYMYACGHTMGNRFLLPTKATEFLFPALVTISL